MVQESFKLYKAISEGIINLADTFFKMPYLEGMRAQEVYNEAVCGGEALKRYHAKLQQMDAVKRVMEFPEFEVPPADFLETMQEHLLTLKKESGSNLLVRLLCNALFSFFHMVAIAPLLWMSSFSTGFKAFAQRKSVKTEFYAI